MAARHEYRLNLDRFHLREMDEPSTDAFIRSPQVIDLEELAGLMLDAYRGTIDDDGETYEDALNEVRAYFSGERGGPARLEQSLLYEHRHTIRAACLVADWTERRAPIIAYVMTRADWKRQGYARSLLVSCLRDLKDLAFSEVWAVITAGNTPSEQLFQQIGFQRLE